jgi:hypothetical protein
MSSESSQRSVWSGRIMVGDHCIGVHVLEDGSYVADTDDFERLCEEEEEPWTLPGWEEFDQFFNLSEHAKYDA